MAMLVIPLTSATDLPERSRVAHDVPVARPLQDRNSDVAARRALELAENIRLRFRAGDGTGLYRERYPIKANERAYSDEWPFSQVHVGVLDMSVMQGEAGTSGRAALPAHRAAQMRYWLPRSSNGLPGFASRVTPPLGHGGDLYYDDNEWVGLAAVQHFLFTGDAASLALAKTLYTLIRTAWNGDPRYVAPGGLRWTQAPGNQDRNTVSTMPAAELALRLFDITGDRAYLSDALRYRDWTRRTLRRRDGLYVDHIEPNGAIDERVFSYNQGVPVGVDVLLYKLTKEPGYLAEARKLADTSLAFFVDGGRIDAQPMPFNAIYFKNLLLLDHVVGGSRYRDAMQLYADRMWRDRRDGATGLFHPPANRHGPGFFLIDQGAMLQIYAVLAWKPEDHARLY